MVRIAKVMHLHLQIIKILLTVGLKVDSSNFQLSQYYLIECFAPSWFFTSIACSNTPAVYKCLQLLLEMSIAIAFRYYKFQKIINVISYTLAKFYPLRAFLIQYLLLCSSEQLLIFMRMVKILQLLRNLILLNWRAILRN